MERERGGREREKERETETQRGGGRERDLMRISAVSSRNCTGLLARAATVPASAPSSPEESSPAHTVNRKQIVCGMGMLIMSTEQSGCEHGV